MTTAQYSAAGNDTPSHVSVACSSSTAYTIATVQQPIPGAVLATLKRFASSPAILGCTLESHPYNIGAQELRPSYFTLYSQAYLASPPTMVTAGSITVIVTY